MEEEREGDRGREGRREGGFGGGRGREGGRRGCVGGRKGPGRRAKGRDHLEALEFAPAAEGAAAAPSCEATGAAWASPAEVCGRYVRRCLQRRPSAEAAAVIVLQCWRQLRTSGSGVSVGSTGLSSACGSGGGQRRWRRQAAEPAVSVTNPHIHQSYSGQKVLPPLRASPAAADPAASGSAAASPQLPAAAAAGSGNGDPTLPGNASCGGVLCRKSATPICRRICLAPPWPGATGHSCRLDDCPYQHFSHDFEVWFLLFVYPFGLPYLLRDAFIVRTHI